MTDQPIDLKGLSSFPERLKKIMKGQSARAFARTSGIDDKSIRKYLSGTGEPTLKNLIKLSTATGVSIQWLATGEEDSKQGIEDKETQKLVELVSKLPEKARREILSRAESLYEVDQQGKELAALKDIILKMANDG